MSACVPVRDMKDTAAFTTLVESERDVTVTKNGYEACTASAATSIASCKKKSPRQNCCLV